MLLNGIQLTWCFDRRTKARESEKEARMATDRAATVEAAAKLIEQRAKMEAEVRMHKTDFSVAE